MISFTATTRPVLDLLSDVEDILEGDLSEFWPLLERSTREWLTAQFDTEGRWGGDPWAPLSGAYAARKARQHPGRGILVATGALRDASIRFTPVKTRDTFRAVIRSPIVQYHQSGTSRMPARPIIPRRLPATALAELERLAADYVSDVLYRQIR